MCVLFLRLGLVTMTMLAGSRLFFAQNPPRPRMPARMAVYYGYPSLVNESHGDVEKAASVFSAYDVVVLGDGIEFPDRRLGRYPEGDPTEHQKTLQILAIVRQRSPATRFYGYVCLGDIQSLKPGKQFLSVEELQQRIQLWKQMGVTGIFLDEAGYDWPVVDRERQNVTVQYVHELGLSAFPNAFYPEELFSLDNLRGKNPRHLPPLFDRRDLFLLESFQVKNGEYEDATEWQQRLRPALAYRRQYGSRIFVTTTYTEKESFQPDKFSYAWWSAWLYDLDGFSWGEPNFAAIRGVLPDRRCKSADPILAGLRPPSSASSDGTLFWRQVGNSLVLVDSSDHSVHLVSSTGSVEAKAVELRLRSSQQRSAFGCGEVQ